MCQVFVLIPHQDLIQIILKIPSVELTRAANYICDYIREYIYEGFRIEEGALLITLSDFFSSKTYRVEYRNLERIDFPYPGLKEFMKMREERDFQFGEGIDESYFSSMPWEL